MDNETTTNESQVRELITTWLDDVDRLDLEGAMAHHSADIVMFDVPTVELRGTDAYRQQWLDFFEARKDADQNDKGKFKLQKLEVVAGDDVAFAYGIVDCADAVKPNFNRTTYRGAQKN